MQISPVSLNKLPCNYYKFIIEKNYKLETLICSKPQLAKMVNDPDISIIIKKYLIRKFEDGSIE